MLYAKRYADFTTVICFAMDSHRPPRVGVRDRFAGGDTNVHSVCRRVGVATRVGLHKHQHGAVQVNP